MAAWAEPLWKGRDDLGAIRALRHGRHRDVLTQGLGVVPLLGVAVLLFGGLKGSQKEHLAIFWGPPEKRHAQLGVEMLDPALAF